jgi:hypothetical protein
LRLSLANLNWGKLLHRAQTANRARFILGCDKLFMRFIVLRSNIMCGAAAVALSVVCVFSSPTLADETGMAGMHTWRKVGKKSCMVDHFHEGSAQGTTQKLAELAAVRAWVSFTDLEYGSDWADFRLAMSRTVKCSREDVARWSCRAEGLACRGR